MATRAQQFHAEEQRHGERNATQRKSRSKPGTAPKDRSQDKEHAGKKATYALELTPVGQRPSRKSTRKSANRSKPDSSFNLIEGLRKGSPESRFRKGAARASRVRGKAVAKK